MSNRYCNIAILIIFILGLLLALNVCLFPHFIDDDADVIYGATVITWDAMSFFGYIHGALSFYLIKLSGFLFGMSPFGWRVVNLLFYVATLYFMYLLLKEAKGKMEACFAVAFTVLNCYFIFYSAYVCEEIFLFFFSLLSIVFFYNFIKFNRIRYLLLTSICIGLGLSVKIQILLLLPGMLAYILIYPETRRTLNVKYAFLSLLLIFLLGFPYLYSLYELPYHTLQYARDMLAFFKPSLKFFNLFISDPMVISTYREGFAYEFGYNTMGSLLGIPCLLAIAISIRQKDDKFVRLMQLIFWGIFLASIFVFCGDEVEPRHYSIAMIPAIAILSALISRFFTQRRTNKRFVVAYLILLLIQAGGFSLCFNYFASQHSKASLAAWGTEEREVDRNELSKAFIKLVKEYKPSLIVFPSPFIDSAAYFVAGYTRIKTLEPRYKYTWNYLNDNDIANILFIFTPDVDPAPFLAWAHRNGYKTVFEKTDKITINDARSILSLPVTILMLAQETKKKIKDVEVLPVIQKAVFKSR